MVENLSAEEHEKLVTFGKLSVNFRKLYGKTWKDILAELSINLHSTQIFPSMFWIYLSQVRQ